MTLEVTDRQAEELRGVLEHRLRELLEEIAHADDRAFRRLLREKYEALEHIQRRLSAALGAPEEARSPL